MSRPKAATKSTPKSVPKTVTQGTPETAPPGTPATVTQGTAQSTPVPAPRSVPQSMPQNAIQPAPQSTAPAPVAMVEVRIDKMLDGHTNTKAFASANLFGMFAIHGLRVIETDKGRFIGMPQESYEKNGERKYSDTFHPITAGARTMLVEAVNIAYEQKLAEQMAQFNYAAVPAQAGMGGMQA